MHFRLYPKRYSDVLSLSRDRFLKVFNDPACPDFRISIVWSSAVVIAGAMGLLFMWMYIQPSNFIERLNPKWAGAAFASYAKCARLVAGPNVCTVCPSHFTPWNLECSTRYVMLLMSIRENSGFACLHSFEELVRRHLQARQERDSAEGDQASMKSLRAKAATEVARFSMFSRARRADKVISIYDWTVDQLIRWQVPKEMAEEEGFGNKPAGRSVLQAFNLGSSNNPSTSNPSTTFAGTDTRATVSGSARGPPGKELSSSRTTTCRSSGTSRSG